GRKNPPQDYDSSRQRPLPTERQITYPCGRIADRPHGTLFPTQATQPGSETLQSDSKQRGRIRPRKYDRERCASPTQCHIEPTPSILRPTEAGITRQEKHVFTLKPFSLMDCTNGLCGRHWPPESAPSRELRQTFLRIIKFAQTDCLMELLFVINHKI